MCLQRAVRAMGHCLQHELANSAFHRLYSSQSETALFPQVPALVLHERLSVLGDRSVVVT